jgi:hypothetical protein
MLTGVLKGLALSLAIFVVTVGSASAAGGGPTSQPAAALTTATFTCDGAKARLARVENRIARIQARIDAGTAKNPKYAARLKHRLERRAARIEARIAANC